MVLIVFQAAILCILDNLLSDCLVTFLLFLQFMFYRESPFLICNQLYDLLDANIDIIKLSSPMLNLETHKTD